MNYKQRSEFRKTDRWHKWKAKCRLHTSRDFITKDNLCKNWNLHHLDLNVQRYDNIEDMKRFMPLNPKTHEIVHEIFKWYKKDHKVLDRLKQTLDLMEEYTYGPDPRNSAGKQAHEEYDSTSDTLQAQQDRKSVHTVKRPANRMHKRP